MSNSALQNAFISLSITSQRQQLAILGLFYHLGYFKKGIIKHDFKSIGHINLIEQTTESIINELTICGAYNKAFSAKKALKSLFKSLPKDNQELPLDLIVYWGQSAFSRSKNQERSELKQPETYATNTIFDLAKDIGFINSITSQDNIYDEGWVLGTSRHEMIDRIKDINNTGYLFRHLRLLTGNRELWAEIDGIGAGYKKTLNGKNYLIKLANFNQISYEQEKPFIKYVTSATPNTSDTIHTLLTDSLIAKGKYQNRTYLNSSTPVTEYMMCKDLITQYYTIKKTPITIHNCTKNQTSRPTTESTILYTMKSITKDASNIYIQTNQPYVLRQGTAIKRILKALNRNINTHTFGREIGVFNELCIKQVLSEIGAWLGELYLLHVSNQHRVRKPKNLMFQTRN